MAKSPESIPFNIDVCGERVCVKHSHILMHMLNICNTIGTHIHMVLKQQEHQESKIKNRGEI